MILLPPPFRDPESSEHNAHDGEVEVNLSDVYGNEIVVGPREVDHQLRNAEHHREDEVRGGYPKKGSDGL